MKSEEPADVALRRELREETSLDLISFTPASVFEYTTTEATKLHCVEIDCLCTVRDVSDVCISPEHADFAWVAKGDIDDYSMTEGMKNSILRCFASSGRELRAETEKWLKKIQEQRPSLKLADETRTDFLTNVDAYIADCEHFLKKGNLILAFEAVTWAWSWVSIGKELGILKEQD